MKAKSASLWAKILAALIALMGSFAKGRGWLPDIEFWQILALSLFIAELFLTVDINIMLDKWRDVRMAMAGAVSVPTKQDAPKPNALQGISG